MLSRHETHSPSDVALSLHSLDHVEPPTPFCLGIASCTLCPLPSHHHVARFFFLEECPMATLMFKNKNKTLFYETISQIGMHQYGTATNNQYVGHHLSGGWGMEHSITFWDYFGPSPWAIWDYHGHHHDHTLGFFLRSLPPALSFFHMPPWLSQFAGVLQGSIPPLFLLNPCFN